MRFKDQHPEWRGYNSTLSTKEFPHDLQQQLHGLLAQYGRRDDVSLANLVNTINAAILKKPTANWGESWLAQDLEESLTDMFRARFDRAMDALIDVASEVPDGYIADLNELFAENGFGYRIELSPVYPMGYQYRWHLADDSAAEVTEAVASTAVSVEDLCQQTSAHLRQLADNLGRDNERALKDAVRDAMSATEALLAQVSGKRDIEDSTKELHTSGTWGPRQILRDGLSIWNHLHQAHGDIRHGNPDATPLPREEALYWIERMLALVNYITRMQRLQEE